MTDILLKKITKNTNPEVVAASRPFFTILFLIILTPVIVRDFTINVSPIYFLLSGVIGALATIFIAKAFSVATVSYVSMFTMIAPVLVAIVGILFLNESMNIYQVVGGLLIIVSGVLVQKFGI